LAEKFGDNRVFNTPIQEAFIIGSTVGMSAVGLKPIVEVQFADYIWPGLNQLFTEVSRSYYLSNGQWPVSCIIRVPIGAYGSGGPYHSSSVESVLLQIRGIKVVYPSTGADLKGLLKAAIRDNDPVVFLESEKMYGDKGEIPEGEYIIPIGVADIKRKGTDVTVVSFGKIIKVAYEAADLLEKEGISVEVIDLRTIRPIDYACVVESVKKTNRCVVLEESWPLASISSEIAYHLQNYALLFLNNNCNCYQCKLFDKFHL
jgi:pyruvate/2-oxoglutarate/acetoin dehydrogenase E1 component